MARRPAAPRPAARPAAVVRLAPAELAPARRWLAAGIPLTLLLDLAAGPDLDSRAILDHEQVTDMVAAMGALDAALDESGEGRESDTEIA